LEHIEVVRIIPEIAITLVGFIGIVFALGHRPESRWSDADWLKVYAMTAAPMTAFFCAFAPDLFGALVASPDHVWRLSNAAIGSLHLAAIFPFLRNMSGIPTTRGQRILGVVGGLLILSHFLAAFGLIPWLAFVFIVGLLQQLYVGMHNFYLLLRPRAGDAS
jgi:hypothetical protein